MSETDPQKTENLDFWVQQAIRSDADAYNRLIDHLQHQLFQVAYYQLGNTEDALDACQDAILSAWRGLVSFQGGYADFRRWLMRITVNACRDRSRHEARRPRWPLEIERDGSSTPLPLPDPGQSPEEYAETADLRALLEACLARLSDEHRTVILLDHLGFGYPEMADVLDVEIGTVKSRLSRARARMRELLIAGPSPPREPAAFSGRSVAEEPPHSGAVAEVKRPGAEPDTGHSEESA